MSAFLPQNDPHIERRRRDLAAVRKQYRWNHTYVSPLSMVEDVPIRDEWAFQWVVLVGARAFDILENQLSLARDQGWLQRLRRWTRLFTTKVRYSRLDGKGLNRLLQDVVAFTIASGRPQSLAATPICSARSSFLPSIVTSGMTGFLPTCEWPGPIR